MARYEMPVIIKALGTAGVKEALKRQLLCMLDNNAVIFNVENLGLRRLPQVLHVQQERQYEGHYFLINFDAPADHISEIRKRANKDTDIIKCFACLKDDAWVRPCSLPDAPVCQFGEIRNPNYEKTARRRHGYRTY
ncbi:Cysteine rich secretory protein LCCL [Paragonimus heterotremus]|uniref:Small ribosomal subunit protein bS6m n=1 Tax=Paragonimus heterotremus TaxID=100268 RepID=A0A8J4T949_9TREM|nr:Cysteine rich secretory protein LCCL [Paragonimus heterotremus]